MHDMERIRKPYLIPTRRKLILTSSSSSSSNDIEIDIDDEYVAEKHSYHNVCQTCKRKRPSPYLPFRPNVSRSEAIHQQHSSLKTCTTWSQTIVTVILLFFVFLSSSHCREAQKENILPFGHQQHDKTFLLHRVKRFKRSYISPFLQHPRVSAFLPNVDDDDDHVNNEYRHQRSVQPPSLIPVINLLNHQQYLVSTRSSIVDRSSQQPQQGQQQRVIGHEFINTTNFQRDQVYLSFELVPHNLSVVLIKWHPQPAIRVSWVFDDKVPCEAFQIMYHPIASRFRYIIEVPCNVRNVTIERLLPSTEYLLTVNTVPSVASFGSESASSSTNTRTGDETRNSRVTIDNDSNNKQHHHHDHRRTSSSTGKGYTTLSNHENGNSRQSYYGSAPNMIRFISPQIEYTRFSKFKSANSLIIRRDPDFFDPEAGVVIVKKGELAVVLFVLSGWLLIIFIFIRKWGKIRGIETVSTFPGSTIHPNMTPSGIPFGSTNAVFPTTATAMSASPQVGGGAGSLGSGMLRSQKSKESDDSASGCVGGTIADGAGNGGTNNSTQGQQTSSTTPIPGVVSSSLKKRRLEDAITQFLVMKTQQSIASGHHYFGTSVGPFGQRTCCDQFMVGRRGVRSQDTYGSRTTRFSGIGGLERRGSLEGRRALKVHSETDLKLLRDPRRMHRSAENLLLAYEVV